MLRKINLSSIVIKVMNDIIHPSNEVKYLGLYITSNLNWKRHTSIISGKVFEILRRLSLRRASLSIGTRILLVKTLVLPLIEYGSVAMTDITQDAESRLKVALNASLRFIYGFGWSTSATPYRKRLNLLSISIRRNYNALIFLFKTIKSQRPSYCVDFLPPNPSHNKTRARGTQNMPSFQNKSFTKTFHYHTLKQWNSLPNSIQNAKSLNSFKNLLLKHLLINDR